MSSLCEQAWPIQSKLPYTLLEYREDGVAPQSSIEDEPAAQCARDLASEKPPVPTSVDAEFTRRLEDERRQIQTSAQAEAERKVAQIRSELLQAIEEFASQRQKYFAQAEAEIVSLALAIARRIIHREVQIDPKLLSGLVSYELSRMDKDTRVRLLVSSESLKYWKEAAERMPQKVEVVSGMALRAGEVRIETNIGSTCVSFEDEIKEIERGFFDLLALRPGDVDAIGPRLQ